MKIEIDGIEREIQIERKRNRNMYLRVRDDGTLHVTCPSYCSQQDILCFVNEKKEWIRKQGAVNRKRKTEVLCGKNHREAVWRGKHYRVRVEHAGHDFLFFDEENDTIVFYLREDTPESIEKTFYKEGNRYLALLIQERRNDWDREICVRNSHPMPHITIKYMTSRWGSCTPARNAISISSRLIHFPDVCLDYVLLHEYAHILVPNHQKEFYNVVRTFMPEYKTYSNMLR